MAFWLKSNSIQEVSVGGSNLEAMELKLSSEFASKIEYLPVTGSTNTDLLALATTNPEIWTDFSVLLTDNQTAGRGRLDRQWEAKPGAGLAVSVLLRPKTFGMESFGWLPLLAGLAINNAVSSLIEDAPVSLKWPNDVLVGGEKISGLLAEVLPDGKGVIIGAGLNLKQTKQDLPIPNATSLALHGVENFELDDILVRYLAAFRNLYEDFCLSEGDPESSGLRKAVQDASSTIGSTVRVLLPDGSEFSGKAVGLDVSGRLLVALSDPLEIRAVAAGDIQHLRQ
jgi:BirA family biotin operon repressor/biotin-[acetyl-CoA-carboxylase] ligase